MTIKTYINTERDTADTERDICDILVEVIEHLVKRVDRLENFITRSQQEWEGDEEMLQDGGLVSTIRSTISGDFYVSTEAHLQANFGDGDE